MSSSTSPKGDIANNYVIIMAGGIGSRFWPFSRTAFPKQFHDILGTGATLIQQTARRFEGICPNENIFVVTNRDYEELTATQLPFLSPDQILTEPIGRNTAPCVAYACSKIAQRNPDANIVVSPADHIITDEPGFRQTISEALAYTSQRQILATLGIKPSRPDTGYGYIQYLESDESLKKVKTFTEKPHLELAQQFIDSGEFVWNSGIFIWNAKAILAAIQEFLPEMAEIFDEASASYYSEGEKAAIDSAYSQCKSISIDYGIMEKSHEVFVLLADFGWSDLGTWKSLYELAPNKDEQGNVVDGNAMVYGTTNSIIKVSPGKLIVVHGLDNYIIAESQDVIMICPKEEEQRVKEFVADTKAKKEKRFI
jgi:mannose-1-phosphate guanylyltransferase